MDSKKNLKRKLWELTILCSRKGPVVPILW